MEKCLISEHNSVKKSELLIKKGFKPLSADPGRENKKNALETKMNNFGLGQSFDRYFFSKDNPKMNQEDVLTLQEFINLNQAPREERFLETRKKEFKKGKYHLLDKQTTSCVKLIELLKEMEFNHQDWAVISKEKRKPVLKNMAKDKIMNLPAMEIIGMYEGCCPAKIIADYFKKPHKEIYIRDLMQLNDQIIFEEMREIISAIQRVQRRLRRHGLKDRDGLFMEAHLDF